MRLSLRFVLPLVAVLALLAYAAIPLADRLTLRWFVRDLDVRSTLVANTIAEPLLARISGPKDGVHRYFAQITEDERLYALGYCEGPSADIVASDLLPDAIRCDNLADDDTEPGKVINTSAGPLHVATKALPQPGANRQHARLVLVHDLSFAQRRSEETRQYIYFFFAALATTVSLITVVIAQLSWRGWVEGTRALLRGEGLVRQPQDEGKDFHPLAADLRALVADLGRQAHGRDESQIAWSAEALRRILQGELCGDDILVVANRQPYIHVSKGGAIGVQQPASGLVTALEPILRACSGTWIAHGNGSADRAVVDAHDRVAVPPGAPEYSIRRIWLNPQQETGFYYGFSNEGLWPLCHNAHVRPTFRSTDWHQYVAVNRVFADAVVAEATNDRPIVLVQDYHFALVPRMVRDRLPRATIIAFWHIPWPNPEAFVICPWAADVVAGLLGSSILGFHTQAHCNNFVDTVDRLIEARVDRETLRVSHQGAETAVRRYPISIAWPPDARLVSQSISSCRAKVRRELGVGADVRVMVGVDRLDYTKGIVERLRAVERLLELRSEWVGKLTLVQIAAPTRSTIDEYRHHQAAVQAQAKAINERFAGAGAVPIVLRVEHHEPPEVYEHFRAADVCLVTSLHDGMNLVAKEFVAARDDLGGVLVLSQFAGASRELPEALIVNPYDVEQCAAALHAALTMDPAEQRQRMTLMRHLVAEFNVYRWAGRMLLDAAVMRRRGRLPEMPRRPIVAQTTG